METSRCEFGSYSGDKPPIPGQDIALKLKATSAGQFTSNGINPNIPRAS